MRSGRLRGFVETCAAALAGAVIQLQDFYLAKGLIQRKSPVEELYTNEFIK
jgi:hypothetical protein